MKRMLPVKPISQLFPIPMVMGCEGVAAAMLLQYNHRRIKATTIMKDWPKHRNNPRKGYVGHQLLVKFGFHQTIFPQAYVPHLKQFHDGFKDGTGKTLDELERIIDAGQPVLIYHTVLGQSPARRWFKLNGTKEQLTSNIHTTVLIGYDDQYYYYIDPLWSQWFHSVYVPAFIPNRFQVIRMPKARMQQSYDAPGRMCIYIQPTR